MATIEHRTWVDEITGPESDGWQAVCPDCSWSSRTVHFDEFDGIETADEFIPPADQAHDQAVLLGEAHTEEAS